MVRFQPLTCFKAEGEEDKDMEWNTGLKSKETFLWGYIENAMKEVMALFQIKYAFDFLNSCGAS